MNFKLGTLVFMLLAGFFTKISIEAAMAEKIPQAENFRSPASIDASYMDHMNKTVNRGGH